MPAIHTFDAAVAAKYKLSSVNSVIVVAQHDDAPEPYSTGFASDAIAAYADANALPLVNEFNDDNAPRLFGGNIKVHLLLFHKGVKNSADAFAQFKQAAAAYRGKFLFITVDADVDEHLRIVEFFGIPDSEFPAIRLIDLTGEMTKYKYVSPTIDAADIKSFLAAFTNGHLKPALLSQDTPADWDAKPVKVLTGNNFADVALNPEKGVFVKFYAPWCGHCKELAPTWDTLAEKFAGNPDIVIAKIDSTLNELADVKVSSYPTLIFFPKGDKSVNVPFEGDRNLATLTSFVEEQIAAAGKASANDVHEDL